MSYEQIPIDIVAPHFQAGKRYREIADELFSRTGRRWQTNSIYAAVSRARMHGDKRFPKRRKWWGDK